MKHMRHPKKPKFQVDAPDDRAKLLGPSGWVFVTPGPEPKDDDKAFKAAKAPKPEKPANPNKPDK